MERTGIAMLACLDFNDPRIASVLHSYERDKDANSVQAFFPGT